MFVSLKLMRLQLATGKPNRISSATSHGRELNGTNKAYTVAEYLLIGV